MAASEAVRRRKLIREYRYELACALEMAEAGQRFVDAGTAGKDLAGRRKKVPITEYIKMWEDGLAALLAGAPLDKYDY